MTPEEIKTLGHAFFDGKTLQYEEDNGDCCYWEDWIDPYCPNFRDGYNWRIKPDEPKKVKFLDDWEPAVSCDKYALTKDLDQAIDAAMAQGEQG